MSRKRAAPDAEPAGLANYQQIQSNQWPAGGAMDQQGNYSNSANFGINPYQSALSALQQQEPSNQLTRRTTNPLAVAPFPSDTDWSNTQFTNTQQGDGNDESWQNSDDELDRRAEAAERAAVSKRKSIPPFVQKLRSFVDDDKNHDLIRWADNGDSFIVLDEDEFAKKLIPELFKHNKYPSFVRQLNMYGFHKRVALSDNSMRASERKSKSPSEYHNPFFKRGRPKLMWLIQKPKSGAAGKKGANGEDLDDDELENEPITGTAARGRQSMTLPNGQIVGSQKVLSQEAASQLHEELTAIRRNQAAIQEEVRKLREENEMMQNRAAAYQAIHQRHENSINAILTFLATVFRNQIEGRDTSSLASLFPQAASRDQQGGDRVVDLADFDGKEDGTPSSVPRALRRPLLLEAGPGGSSRNGDDAKPRVTSVSTPTASEYTANDDSAAPSPGNADSQPQVKKEPGTDSGANDDIFSFLNSQSGGSGGNIGRIDYPQALSQLQSANSKSPISTPQRNDLLRLMANSQVGNVLNGDSNNALTSPSPPPIPGPTDPSWAARSKEIEALERSLREQNDRFNSVTQLLGPLSPSGSINFTDHDGDVPPPTDFDLDWLSAANNDGTALTNLDSNDNPFFDFKDYDADNNGTAASGSGSLEGLPTVGDDADESGAPSPAGTVKTVEGIANDGSPAEEVNPPNKRQRTS